MFQIIKKSDFSILPLYVSLSFIFLQKGYFILEFQTLFHNRMPLRNHFNQTAYTASPARIEDLGGLVKWKGQTVPGENTPTHPINQNLVSPILGITTN